MPKIIGVDGRMSKAFFSSGKAEAEEPAACGTGCVGRAERGSAGKRARMWSLALRVENIADRSQQRAELSRALQSTERAQAAPLGAWVRKSEFFPFLH